MMSITSPKLEFSRREWLGVAKQEIFQLDGGVHLITETRS